MITLEDLKQSKCITLEDLKQSKCITLEDLKQSKCITLEDLKQSKCIRQWGEGGEKRGVGEGQRERVLPPS